MNLRGNGKTSIKEEYTGSLLLTVHQMQKSYEKHIGTFLNVCRYRF